MVGTERFELSASCSQSRRANQTTLRPVKKTLIYNSSKISKEIYSIKNNTFFDKTFFQFAKNASRYHDALIRNEEFFY